MTVLLLTHYATIVRHSNEWVFQQLLRNHSRSRKITDMKIQTLRELLTEGFNALFLEKAKLHPPVASFETA